MNNVVKYRLFNIKIIELIAWLVGYFQFYDLFR